MSTYAVAHLERFTTSHIITAVVLTITAIALIAAIYAQLKAFGFRNGNAARRVVVRDGVDRETPARRSAPEPKR